MDHPQYLLKLAELELIDLYQRMVQRRVPPPAFPRQEPGRLRLHGHPIGEQTPGDGTGTLRIRPAP